MHDILKKILLQKQKEVASLKSRYPTLSESSCMREFRLDKSLKKALKNEKLSVIAEIKRHSPSRGSLATIENPVSLALEYLSGGANVISVLTDMEFFGGTLQDMVAVSNALKDSSCPVLRKDFIIDFSQLYEAVDSGADAVLLIVALLGNKTRDFLEVAKKINIEALVEVHTEAEIELALGSGSEIIGINNRNLNTFQVDINRSLELVELLPKGVVKVAESGIRTPEEAKRLKCAGFDAILVGETLVQARNLSFLIEGFKK